MFEKVRDILVYILNVDADSITMETDIMNDLSADSLDVVEIATELENQFNIMIPQDSLADVKTVGQVVDMVESLMK